MGKPCGDARSRIERTNRSEPDDKSCRRSRRFHLPFDSCLTFRYAARSAAWLDGSSRLPPTAAPGYRAEGQAHSSGAMNVDSEPRS
jgi:hypothetical protein